MVERGVAGFHPGTDPECITVGVGGRRSLADVGTGARLDATAGCACNPSADTSFDPDPDLDAAAAHARADPNARSIHANADPYSYPTGRSVGERYNHHVYRRRLAGDGASLRGSRVRGGQLLVGDPVAARVDALLDDRRWVRRRHRGQRLALLVHGQLLLLGDA